MTSQEKSRTRATMEFDENSQLQCKASVTTEMGGSSVDGSTYKKIKINHEFSEDTLPLGYRFCPKDEELVGYYLKKKVMKEALPCNKIVEVDLYRHNPEMLAEKYKHQFGEKELYFFTPRDRKYKNGTRPNRAAGDGYWKATGGDKAIKVDNVIVGYKKALVFYRGKPPKGNKTNWIMHEYSVNDPPRNKSSVNDMRLDEWVLCSIYKKAEKLIKTEQGDEEFCPAQYPPIAAGEGENELVDRNSDPNEDYIHQPFQNGLPDIPQVLNIVSLGNQPVEPVGFMPPMESNNWFMPRDSMPGGIEENDWDNISISELLEFDFDNNNLLI